MKQAKLIASENVALCRSRGDGTLHKHRCENLKSKML
jgi:hypothetical protein